MIPHQPSPDEIRDLARRHHLSGSQAAALIHVDGRRWRQFAGGERSMSPAAWELLLLKVGDHPDYIVHRRGERPGQGDAPLEDAMNGMEEAEADEPGPTAPGLTETAAERVARIRGEASDAQAAARRAQDRNR